jgi:hypothetical protein
MMQIVLVGLGAGAASALLFASVISGAPLSLILAYLAPLPILIVALGWSHWAGLVAATSAAIALGAVIGFHVFLGFLLGVALPAWWLGYLALLARPAASGADVEWYPVGRLVLWAALVGTGVVAVSLIMTFGSDKDSFQAGLRSLVEQVVRLQARRSPGSIEGVPEKDLIEAMITAAPRVAAIFATLVNVFNLWLAGRIVRVSGRLPRPWPDLSAMALPRMAPVLLAAAVAGMFLPDLASIVAGTFAASLFVVYALLGLAVLHTITRGNPTRPFALAATYVTIIPLAGLPILAMTMLGFAETAFNIRARVAGRRPPSKPHLKPPPT